jgi:cbb3-type cytochrome oxidase subunit 3
MEWLMWFTKFENTKPLALTLFMISFCAILWYVFGNKKRGAHLESHKNIPFHED